MKSSLVSFIVVVLLAAILLVSTMTWNEIRHLSATKSVDTQAARHESDPTEALSNPAPRKALISLERDSISKLVEEDYQRVAGSGKFTAVTDGSGGVKGITTDNIEGFGVAKELGLRNGDVLQSINNELVTSEGTMVEIVKKFRHASMFRVGIERDGQSIYMTFRLR